MALASVLALAAIAGSLTTALAVEPAGKIGPGTPEASDPRPFRAVLPALANDTDGSAAVAAAAAATQVHFLAPEAGRFQSPLARFTAVTDRFGAPRENGRIHGGIDLALDTYPASPVYSACDGTVVLAGWDDGYGNHVIVDCGGGFETLYGHLSAFTVQPGMVVVRGQQLGISGSTGFSTGEHLHFEIRKDGVPVDPELYVDFGIPPGTPLTSGEPLDTLSTTAPEDPAPFDPSLLNPTPTPTPAPATEAAQTPTPEATPSPAPTATPTPSATPTPTPTPTPEVVPPLPSPASAPSPSPTPTLPPEAR